MRRQGIEIAAISYDTQEILATFSERRGITFPLLSDVGSATITRYGILNTIVDEALDYTEGDPREDPSIAPRLRQVATVNLPREEHRGIPFPGTFIVDRQGLVTARFFEDFYRERRTAANILLRLGQGLEVPGTELSTNHLELTTYPSDSTVALGSRFALVLDVTPRPDMHVYAPGASGYRIISLTIEPQPFVRIAPVQFPESEIYYFEPLDERVPVYQEAFQLVQEVVPDVTPEAIRAFEGRDSLTLTGQLDYQACDHEICYNPESIPLSWTVAVQPFVPGG